MPEIRIENLSVTYIDKKKNEYPAISDFSFTFPSNQVSAICGDNGCGKSTLLKAICCMFRFDGYIYIDDVNIESKEISFFNIGYVDQNFALFPTKTVFENIAGPLKYQKMDSEEIERKVRLLAEELQISSLLGRIPRQLSIGQQQRVAIARALIKSPKILLLDEIMSNIDEPTQNEIRKLLKAYIKKYAITCLYVTHNKFDAKEIADNTYNMCDNKLSKIL